MGTQGKVNLPNMTVTQVLEDQDTVTNDLTLFMYRWICHCFIAQVICIFGTVTNIINVVCFAKLGFQDPVNVTLFGMAISDLASIVTMIWFNIFMTPVVRDADLLFDVDNLLYLVGGWPHVTFARVTSILTAFLTLERCICIAMPLKVNRIFTSKRAAIFVVTFFILLLVSVSPIYCVTRFGMVFIASRNKTIRSTVQTEGLVIVYTATIAVNNIIIPVGAFATVIICTTILVISLHRKTKWRKSVVANSEQVFTRDQKVSKMILIISTVFIICFIPCCVSFLAVAIEPSIEIYGMYRNTLMLLFGLSFTFESANSSVNIFIYYNMSSKFRTKFRELFRMSVK